MLKQLTILLGLSIWLIASQEGETDTLDEESEDIPADEGVKVENDVYVLTVANFDDFLNSKEVVMVEFYAPWCGHCKKLAPEYDAAAIELKDAGSVGVLAKVDATVEEEIATRYGVGGYPTLKIFKKGLEPINYDGGRTTFDIVEKMKELSDPDWMPPPSEVIELTTETFDEIVNSQPIMLVEFFAPWCGHCKKLKPVYEDASRQLKTHGIPLATVDATEEKTLASKYDVTGYPTLKIFRYGKVSDYKGGRTASDIVKTMLIEKDPHTFEITTSAHKKEVEKPSTVGVVGLFPGLDKDSVEYQIFEELTNEFRSGYPASHSFDTNFASKYFKVSTPSVVVVYPALYVAKKEKAFSTIAITTESSIEDLTQFVSEHDKPLVGDYDCKNCEKIYDAVDTLRVYTSKDYGKGFDKNTKYWQEKTASVAKKFSGKGLYFVMCDEAKQSADMTAMKLNELGAETVFGIKTSGGDKYSPDNDVLDDMDDFAETLEEFVESYLAGELKARRKSAPVPKKQGAVTVVVASTFESIVEDPTRDVLIEFYAPWCGHCKALEPKYKQLAKDLKDDKNLVIAKLDTTANDYPSKYTVKGFPTIYLVPAGADSDPIEYSGEREAEDLKKFIKDNAVLAFGGGEVLREEL